MVLILEGCPAFVNSFTFFESSNIPNRIFHLFSCYQKIDRQWKKLPILTLYRVIFLTSKPTKHLIYNDLRDYYYRTPFGIVLAFNNRELVCLKYL